MPRQAEAGGIDPYRGRMIGKYEILTRLSVGGMAELFLAYTSGPGGFRKFVAVKQILPDVKTDEFIRMFLDEARITAAFSHPNIGQVFELGEEHGELYLAMEFLPGQNLEQILVAASPEGPMPMGFAARVVRDVCLGLHYAHHFSTPSGRKVAVVHRDLAPRNVMVTYDGVVKVIDFGIAKARGRIARTAVGMVKGTSGYMSPEQVRGHDLDGRSDLFTAGVLLHELLCGQRLFDTVDEIAMMKQIAHGDVPPPSSRNPEVPEALDVVVMRALAKDPARRFASGREMAKAIEQAVGSELFDEEAVAELMQALFADKRLKTLALLEEQEPEMLEDPSDLKPTAPMRALPSEEPPPRAAAPRPASPRARAPARRARAGGESPPNPAGARPAPTRAVLESPPRRGPVLLGEDDAPTQVSPGPVKAARPAPEPEANAGRRPPRMGMFTLGQAEPSEDSEEGEDSGAFEASQVSRVSRVSRALMAMERPTRRGLWFIAFIVLVGIAVLFMPAGLRARLGSLFVSAGHWVFERLSADAGPQAVPVPAPAPVIESAPIEPPADAYEPPPPGEGSVSAEEPEEEPPARPPPPPPTPPRVRKPEPATPPPSAPSRPREPVKASKPANAAPENQGEPETPPAQEIPEEPVEPSIGPAEVDPSIQPLELSPPKSLLQNYRPRHFPPRGGSS